MPKAFPLGFRRDAVAVARCQSEAPIAQVARDLGISASCLQRWRKLDDVEEGRRPGVRMPWDKHALSKRCSSLRIPASGFASQPEHPGKWRARRCEREIRSQAS